MTDKQFLALLEKNNDKLLSRFEVLLEQSQQDQTRDLKDYVDSSISASEKRVKKEIIEGVGSLLDHGILPQIDALDRRVSRLERRLA